MKGARLFLLLPKTRYLRQVAKAELKFKLFSSALLSFPWRAAPTRLGICVPLGGALFTTDPFSKKKKKKNKVLGLAVYHRS